MIWKWFKNLKEKQLEIEKENNLLLQKILNRLPLPKGTIWINTKTGEVFKAK